LKTILTIADYYLPGYRGGGPIRTIANTVDWLGDEFDFRILTRDRDLGDAHAYSTIQHTEWLSVGKASVRYLAPNEQNPIALRTSLQQTNYDFLYLNSFFSVICVKAMFAQHFGRLPQKPVLIAPRNEFYPGALAFKRFKKQSYLHFVKFLGIYNNVFWQASSNYEAEQIKAVFPEAKTFVAANMPAKSLPDIPNISKNIKKNITRIIFLSRLTRKKNLDYALRVLTQTKSEIIFDIFGPIEDPTYWSECEQLIQRLPPNITVTYKGELLPEQVIETFAQYHLFLFPTHGENYGHVIWESLYAGCPVLLSDQTPWRDLAKKNVGWDIPLNAPEQFVQAIEAIAVMSETNHRQHAQAAQEYGQQMAHDKGVLDANRRLFHQIVESAQ
jgi:glycosyltransferase involved in cell wall biosynthesis